MTRDGKRSAQYEHTMVVTADGVEILTRRNEDSRGCSRGRKGRERGVGAGRCWSCGNNAQSERVLEKSIR